MTRQLDQVADCCCRGDVAALEKMTDGMKPELLHSACHQGRATSLTLAIKSGHLPVVEFLWSRGAEQHLRDKASCLTAAISSGEEPIYTSQTGFFLHFNPENKVLITPFKGWKKWVFVT